MTTQVLEATADPRSLKGMLLPYGEVGSTNLGPLSWSKGAVQLPADPSTVKLTMGHGGSEVLGHASSLEDTDAGVLATFEIHDTFMGNRLLQDQKEGRKKAISAEVYVDHQDGQTAKAGRLFGAAAVVLGAYAGAGLFEAVETSAHSEDEFTDENGVTWRRVSDTTTTVNDDGSTESETTTKTTTSADPVPDETTDAQPVLAAAHQEGNTNMTGAVATVPNTLTAAVAETPARTSLRELARTLANVHENNDRTLMAELAEPDGAVLFAALNDIKSTYAGSVGENIIQPQFIGELWSGRDSERKIIPLISQQSLTSMKITGWKWLVKPVVQAWAGDKTNVPSNNPTTDDYALSAIRYAGAHDIAREFIDFSVEEFWTGYLKAMTESYSKVTDDAALAALVAGATSVTAGTVPSGVNAATAALVDGALAVVDKGNPSFAVVAKDVYRSLLLQGKDDLIATLSLSLGLESGDLSGFKIVPHANMASGKVLVGAKEAATSWELPGSPIRVDAQDLARGGVDTGFFGYHVTGINLADALALVTVGS